MFELNTEQFLYLYPLYKIDFIISFITYKNMFGPMFYYLLFFFMFFTRFSSTICPLYQWKSVNKKEEISNIKQEQLLKPLIKVRLCRRCSEADGYLRESSIFMRGFVKMGVMEAEGTVWGDWGGVTAGEGREGLSEVLPPASFPFSLYRCAPAGKNNTTCNGNTRWRQQNPKQWRKQIKK